MTKKIEKKDVLFILLAIAALAVVAFMLMPAKEHEDQVKFDLTAMARTSTVVVDKAATEEEILSALVLNTKAVVKADGENVAEAFTENAVMDAESMTATEDGVFATYAIEEGLVTVEVTYANETATVSFELKYSDEIETTSENVRSNYYDVASYALNSSERNIMDPEKGYHYSVTDENGNTIGTATADEISGTEAGDAAIAADPNLDYSQTNEGDTWIEASASTPEQSYEVVTDVQEIEEVVETPVVVEEVTTEEAPVMDASTAQAEAAAEEAATSEITASAEYADLAILKADGSVVTYFGNGSNHAMINEQNGESCFVEDLGEGHVNTCVGIMRY